VRRAICTAAVIALAACTSSSTSAPRTTTAPAPTTTTRPTTSKGCGAGTSPAPGTVDETLTSGGVERVFQLEIPPSYDGTMPFPLLFDLHALTVDHRFAVPIAGLSPKDSTRKYVSVAPSGRLDGTVPFWFAVPTSDNYDVAFIRDLLDHLETELCVDPSRVFFTGISNGAQMSSLVACDLSDRVTAIAPISGVEFLPPCDGEPVPILAFHGVADPIIPYTGGGLNALTIAKSQFFKDNVPPGLPDEVGVDEAMRRWADHNGCGVTYKQEDVTPTIHKRTGPDGKADTVLYVLDGVGHCWPGHGMPSFEASFGPCTDEIDATTLMLSFFFDR